mgnify:CR=1 FL=1
MENLIVNRKTVRSYNKGYQYLTAVTAAVFAVTKLRLGIMPA